MADKQVSIKLDASLNGNAASRLDELAAKAKTAADAARALQDVYKNLSGPFGTRATALQSKASTAIQAAPIPLSGVNRVSSFYSTNSAPLASLYSNPVKDPASDRLRESIEKLRYALHDAAGKIQQSNAPSPNNPFKNPEPDKKKKSKTGTGKRGLFNFLSNGSLEVYNSLAGGALAGFATSLATYEMNRATGISNIFQNRDMPESLKRTQLIEQAPIIGSLFKSFGELVDSLTGLTEKIRQSEVEFNRFTNQLQIYREARVMALPKIQEEERIAATVQSYQGYPIGIIGNAPTPGNQYEINRFQQRESLLQQQEQAQRERYKAGEMNRNADQRIQQSEAAIKAAEAKIQQGKALETQVQAREKFGIRTPGISGNGASLPAELLGGSLETYLENKSLNHARQMALRMQEQGMLEKARAQDELRQAREEKLAAARAMVQAGGMERQAGLGLLREEYQDTASKEARLTNQYQTFGGMLPGTRGAAIQAFKQTNRLGYESLGQYQRGLIKSLRPEFARKQEEKLGLRYSKEFEEIRRLAPEQNDDLRSLQELRETQVNLSQQLGVAVTLDAQKTAEETAKLLGPLIKQILITIAETSVAKIELDEVKRKQAMGGAAGR